MKEDLKNELLKQVGTVLQFCQEIVSKLSSPQCCNHNTSEYESLVNLSDIMTKTFVSDCDSQYELSTRSSSKSSEVADLSQYLGGGRGPMDVGDNHVRGCGDAAVGHD